MTLKFANNARATILAAITTTDTQISVSSGDGDKFPATTNTDDWFPLVLVDSSGNQEIVRCTARAGGMMTITRAQENTAARSFAAGSFVEMRMTKRAFEDFAQEASVLDRFDLKADAQAVTDALNLKAGKSANLSDLPDKAEARKNLEVVVKTRTSPDTSKPQWYDPTQAAGKEWRDFGSPTSGVSGHVSNVDYVILDLRPYIDSNWADFELVVSSFTPSVDGLLAARVSTDNAVSWITSSYRVAGEFTSGDVGSVFDDASATSLHFSPTTSAAAAAHSVVRITRTPAILSSMTTGVSRIATPAAVTQGVVAGFCFQPATHLLLFPSAGGQLSELRYSLRKIERP